jgi:hypothetical protein
MSAWGPGTTAYREALEVLGAARRVGDGAWLLEPFAPPSVCPACAEAYRVNYVIAQGRAVRDRATLVFMRRVLFVVLVILVVAQAGCRSSREDKKDTQRVERRVTQGV